MRVLFYFTEKQWSGCARAILVAARGLAGRGHVVTLACCAGSRLEQQARAAGLDLVPIGGSISAVGGAIDLRRVLRDRFIEVAIVTSERDQLIVASAMRAAERGAVLRRIAPFERTDVRRTGKLALKLAASGLVYSTERDASDAPSAGWSLPPVIAPIGVDSAEYDDVEPASRSVLQAPQHATIIACAYDPAGRYRLATVFRTVALLASRHGNIHVVVFGPGSIDDDLRMHAAALGVSSVVSFLGEREDERSVMRAAAAGWVVAGADAAAFACLDFMALRVPVIAERAPLAQHYVADGITGLLLSPGEASHTASHVAAFLALEDRRAAMGNAGRARVQREFPLTAMLDGFDRAVNAAGDRSRWAVA
ncbi:MAG TPA: glycosyltransferase [Gemmatimonadaceae bacterium]|nr:glycosyltransferase [Gemmatimonadaceae bacterium]